MAGDQYVRADTDVDVKVLAEIGASLVVIDTFLSRPGGGSYCQTGQEQFLRVSRVDGEVPQVTSILKLVSCWQEIELADPGTEWSPIDSTLKVHCHFGAVGKMKPEELILRPMQE